MSQCKAKISEKGSNERILLCYLLVMLFWITKDYRIVHKVLQINGKKLLYFVFCMDKY